MPGLSKIKGINRIIDANTNRLKEGLRVCEDITRFILESAALSAGLKGIRHKVNSLSKRLSSSRELLKERESLKDVGRKITSSPELRRNNYRDILFANLARVKESLRVLEEFSKISSVSVALGFKQLRYRFYELEKKIYRAISLRLK